MLTVHDRTFEMRWSCWGKHTPLAERMAGATYVRLLRMSPAQIYQLASSKRAQMAMSNGARLAMRQLLTARGVAMPAAAEISLEVVDAKK